MMKNKLNLKVAFLFLTFASFGCKDNTPKVRDLNLVDLQITNLSIEKNDIPTLKNVIFSIDNNNSKNKETAEIYNLNKIENGLDISKIKLNISYNPISVLSLEYSVGNSEFKPFDPQKDSVEIGNDRVVRIKLLPKDNTIPANIYKLNIRQYDYKSGTIDYQETQENINISSLRDVISNGNTVDLYTYNNKNICKIIAKDLSVTDREIVGIPSSEKINNIVYVSPTEAYAISDNGNVYKQTERYGQFSNLSNLTNIKAILGYITNGSSVVAMIQHNPGEKAKFLIYGNNKTLVGSEVPDDFVSQKIFSINDSKEWVGGNIYLFSGYKSDGSVNRKCWYTTNGEDWIVSNQNGLPENIERYSITKYNNNLYYLIVTKDKNVKLFISSDNGYNWEESPAGLPENITESGIKDNAFTTFAIDNTYYILIDKAGRSLVYKGILRRLTDR